MELGLSAFTTASHIILILAAVHGFHVVQTLMLAADGVARFGQSSYARLSVMCVLATLVGERIYYVLARLLAPYVFELWAQHPAPEILSALVAISLFNLSAAGIWVMTLDSRRAMTRISHHALILVTLYASIVIALF
jgi:hypothetical protein